MSSLDLVRPGASVGTRNSAGRSFPVRLLGARDDQECPAWSTPEM